MSLKRIIEHLQEIFQVRTMDAERFLWVEISRNRKKKEVTAAQPVFTLAHYWRNSGWRIATQNQYLWTRIHTWVTRCSRKLRRKRWHWEDPVSRSWWVPFISIHDYPPRSWTLLKKTATTRWCKATVTQTSQETKTPGDSQLDISSSTMEGLWYGSVEKKNVQYFLINHRSGIYSHAC